MPTDERLNEIVHEQALGAANRRSREGRTTLDLIEDGLRDAFGAILASAAFTLSSERQQTRLLRRGLIPHAVLQSAESLPPKIDDHSIALQAHLTNQGLFAEADFLKRLDPIILVREWAFLLRVIYPEIETVFRKTVYDLEDGQIGSFKEARWAILLHAKRSSPNGFLKFLEGTDPFVIAQLAFMDLAYLSVEKMKKSKEAQDAASRRPYHRYQWSLGYLGNRNEILHGLVVASRSEVLSEKIAINVMTLYASMMTIVSYLSKKVLVKGARLGPCKEIDQKEVRDMRSGLAASLRRHGRVLSEPSSEPSKTDSEP
jgi:hypothetical protein